MKYAALLDFATNEKPMISAGVTARVNVSEGTVDFTFFKHFYPRREYPFRSYLFVPQGYSSTATCT